MMARSVAQYLMRFASSDSAQAIVEEPSERIEPVPCAGLPLENPVLANRVAREEGVSEGLEMARAEYEARLMLEKHAFEARLGAERNKWAEQESEKLSEKIESAFAKVESNIGESVEAVLRPFLVDALRRKIVDLLAEHVGALLRGGADPVIKIYGAEGLLAALREKLSARSAAIEYAPGDMIEVEVVSGRTIIETRIAAWIERINSLPE